MSWDAIGPISQALGSFAVFVTLIYLAIQVRCSGPPSAARSARPGDRHVALRRLRSPSRPQRWARTTPASDGAGRLARGGGRPAEQARNRGRRRDPLV